MVRSVASSLRVWSPRPTSRNAAWRAMYGAGCFDEYTNQPSRSLNEQAWVAAGSNSLATLASLLDSEGYDVNWRNEKNNQLTALAIACERGHATCVDMLISKGADLNLPSMGGFTPLMLAAAHMPHSSFMDAGNRTTLWTDAHGRAAAAPTGAFSSGRVIPAEVDSAPGDGKLACTPPQKSIVTPCSSVSPRPAMATRLRVTSSHGHEQPCSCSCYALLVYNASAEQSGLPATAAHGRGSS